MPRVDEVRDRAGRLEGELVEPQRDAGASGGRYGGSVGCTKMYAPRRSSSASSGSRPGSPRYVPADVASAASRRRARACRARARARRRRRRRRAAAAARGRRSVRARRARRRRSPRCAIRASSRARPWSPRKAPGGPSGDHRRVDRVALHHRLEALERRGQHRHAAERLDVGRRQHVRVGVDAGHPVAPRAGPSRPS